jgi:hypothetical protein
MENIEIWNKARSLNLGIDFLNGLDELLNSLESNNKQLIIADVSKSFYCERKENGYKDSVCSEQCTICGLIEKTKQ